MAAPVPVRTSRDGKIIVDRKPVNCPHLWIVEENINYLRADTICVVTDITMSRDLQAVPSRKGRFQNKYQWRAFANTRHETRVDPGFPWQDAAGVPGPYDQRNSAQITASAAHALNVPRSLTFGPPARARARSMPAMGMPGCSQTVLTHLPTNTNRIRRTANRANNNAALRNQAPILAMVYQAVLRQAFLPTFTALNSAFWPNPSTDIAIPLIGASPELKYSAEESASAAIREVLAYFNGPGVPAARRLQVTDVSFVVHCGDNKAKGALLKEWREQVEILPAVQTLPPALEPAAAKAPVRHRRDATQVRAQNNEGGAGAYDV